MEQDRLAQDEEQDLVVAKAGKAADEWEETALVPDRRATASAHTAGRKSSTVSQLLAIR